MMLFQQCTEERIPSSDIQIFESNGINISWGSFKLSKAIDMPKYSSEIRSDEISQTNRFLLSHFHLSGSTSTQISDRYFEFLGTQHTLFSFRRDVPVTLHIRPSGIGKHSFFEYSFSEQYFRDHCMIDSAVVEAIVGRSTSDQIGWVGRNLQISPVLSRLIQEIVHHPYTGAMRDLYMESKVMELYIAQIYCFDKDSPLRINLRQDDTDRIYAVKALIDSNLDKSIAIVELARCVGINQTKLKAGFKQLFGSTIFDYTLSIKMDLAMSLLREGHLTLLEISERVGYSHPNHFSYAFKRHFGAPPSSFM